MIADLLAQDADGHDVLVVVVRGMPLDADMLDKYFTLIERECPSAAFAMVADPSAIYVKRQGQEPHPETYRILDLARILSHYDPEAASKRISWNYRKGLLESWLEDMIYHWKSAVPPESDQLAVLGLLERLEKGAVYREVTLGADASLR